MGTLSHKGWSFDDLYWFLGQRLSLWFRGCDNFDSLHSRVYATNGSDRELWARLIGPRDSSLWRNELRLFGNRFASSTDAKVLESGLFALDLVTICLDNLSSLLLLGNSSLLLSLFFLGI